jgi:hypothetical protein
MRKTGMISCLVFVSPMFVWAQGSSAEAASAQVPAQIVVTIGHHYGRALAALTQDEVTVAQRFDPRRITSLIPLRGDRGGLELFLLVDDCSSCEPGSKFEEVRRFIDSQSPTTAVGVAYIHNGNLEVIENPTRDHARAVLALNAPTGSKLANPFKALAELIRGWPRGPSRRAIVMISNGLDPEAKELGQDPSADDAIEAAQRAGIAIYAIYHPSADYQTEDYSKIYAGQVQLAHVSGETGGEAYFLGMGPLPSLTPFLADIADHLANQYLLEFLVDPLEGPGALQEVTVKSKVPDVELMAPSEAWVPGRSTDPRHNLSQGKLP